MQKCSPLLAVALRVPNVLLGPIFLGTFCFSAVKLDSTETPFAKTPFLVPDIFGSLWGRPAGVTFESLLSHFNSFGASGLPGGHQLHNGNHFPLTSADCLHQIRKHFRATSEPHPNHIRTTAEHPQHSYGRTPERAP